MSLITVLVGLRENISAIVVRQLVVFSWAYYFLDISTVYKTFWCLFHGLVSFRRTYRHWFTKDSHSSPVRAKYGCLSWVRSLAEVLPLNLLHCAQYRVRSPLHTNCPDHAADLALWAWVSWDTPLSKRWLSWTDRYFCIQYTIYQPQGNISKGNTGVSRNKVYHTFFILPHLAFVQTLVVFRNVCWRISLHQKRIPLSYVMISGK